MSVWVCTGRQSLMRSLKSGCLLTVGMRGPLNDPGMVLTGSRVEGSDLVTGLVLIISEGSDVRTDQTFSKTC